MRIAIGGKRADALYQRSSALARWRDAAEKVVVRKRLRRRQVLEFFKALPPCLIGIEACATAHHWARELTKLGHRVRLMPAKDVKAYVKRYKNDTADAEAICEAVRRPTMRFVQIKSAEQQGRLMLHRTRDLLMRQRTLVINALRAHLAELGIVAAQGREGTKELLKIIASEEDGRLPVDAHTSLVVLAAELQAMQTLIGSIEKRITVQHRSSEASQRLESIPGIGVIGATAIAATVPDPKVFRSGRDFAAWIGLVPREDSSGPSSFHEANDPHSQLTRIRSMHWSTLRRINALELASPPNLGNPNSLRPGRAVVTHDMVPTRRRPPIDRPLVHRAIVLYGGKDEDVHRGSHDTCPLRCRCGSCLTQRRASRRAGRQKSGYPPECER